MIRVDLGKRPAWKAEDRWPGTAMIRNMPGTILIVAGTSD
jgi:hypothetical protein